jgi:SAM-dependent methyltransferase
MTRLFHQTNVPVNQNLLYKTQESAKNAILGDLDIQCNDSGYIFNTAFDINKVNYGDDYDNNQNCSSYFEAYIDRQIEWLLGNYVSDDVVLIEVGCGKGYYIEKIAQKRNDCRIYGFDTSYNGNVKNRYSNLQIFKKYYDEEYKYLHPDVVICRHVIEHIHQPEDFLCKIRSSMAENAVLFLETPDAEWILRNNVIFDFFYEHCSYWTKSSLENILRISRFEPIETKIGFNGQYLWSVSKASRKSNTAQLSVNTPVNELCSSFSEKRECEIKTVTDKLSALKKEAKQVYVWGAGAKGSTFVNLFDPHQELISGVIDINPNKQNKYIAKTAHKVLSPSNLIRCAHGGGGIITLNNNYKTEIEKEISSCGLECNIYTYEDLK